MKKITNICYQSIFAVVTAALVSNCVPTKNLSDKDRASIRKVYINPYVKMPAKPIVQTRGDVLAMSLAGPIGGAIAASNMSSEDMTVQYLKTHNIKVDQMFHNDFSQHLKKSGYFTVVDSPSQADAQMNLEVVIYGIGQNGNAFSNKYRTFMNATGTLSKNGSSPLWKNYAVCTAIDGDRPQSRFD
jgi:hypothetical protein